LEEQIAENKLEGKVQLLGARNQEYIFSHLKEYDALLQPSIFEGFGLVAVEAMAAKIPVIASDIDGLAEVLDNGRYGICFPSGNISECANAINRLCEEPYNEARLNEIYDYAKSNFDVKKTAENYINEYTKR
jgi:glycosyltransferase involved in cell wall biosynthesis